MRTVGRSAPVPPRAEPAATDSGNLLTAGAVLIEFLIRFHDLWGLIDAARSNPTVAIAAGILLVSGVAACATIHQIRKHSEGPINLNIRQK